MSAALATADWTGLSRDQRRLMIRMGEVKSTGAFLTGVTALELAEHYESRSRTYDDLLVLRDLGLCYSAAGRWNLNDRGLDAVEYGRSLERDTTVAAGHEEE